MKKATLRNRGGFFANGTLRISNRHYPKASLEEESLIKSGTKRMEVVCSKGKSCLFILFIKNQRSMHHV